MSNDETKQLDPLTNAARKSGGRPFSVALLVASVIATATFFVSRAWLPDNVIGTPDMPSQPSVAVGNVSRVDSTNRIVERAAFFDNEVEPEIEKTDRLNREAAERCISRLKSQVTLYRQQVEPFVEDLTSLSTRFGIISRMPGGWWSEDERVEDFVAAKFEKHLFSEQKLLDDVAEILEQFRTEVDANQNRMLVNVKSCLDVADLPEVQVDDYEQFYRSVAQELSNYSAQQGSTSVYNALTVLVMSEAGSYAAVTLVSGLLVRFGAMAATTAATAGGVTAGATATGAGGGSLAGPVGTAVGLGVGLVIGLAIDWWMTEEFEEEMSLQLNNYLGSLEGAILYGSKPGAPEPGASGPGSEVVEGGVADALPVVCQQLEMAYREKFYEQIVTVEMVK